VDIDTGWGGAFNISRTVKEMIKAGAGAVHLEDQVAQKRCGHRPNKEIVSQEEMVDRVKAAVDGKTDDDFFIIARTDAGSAKLITSDIDSRDHKFITGERTTMISTGIIDPVLVTKSALRNAVSVVTTIISADCVINNIRVVNESS
jgi:isocitrate lyase